MNAKSSTWAPLFPGVIALMSIMGLSSSYFPLLPTRPSHGDALSPQRDGLQDVSARLWEDPIEAVRRHVKRERESSKDSRGDVKKVGEALERVLKAIGPADENGDSSNNEGRDTYAKREKRSFNTFVRDCGIDEDLKDDSKTLIVPVLMDGSDYSESIETRIRTRNALVYGLANSGLAPRSNTGIGYIHANRWIGQEGNTGDIYVPYEVYDREDKGNRIKSAVVLWIDEGYLGKNPATRVMSIMRNMQGLPDLVERGFALIRVIGPSGSGVLQKLALETPSNDGATLGFAPQAPETTGAIFHDFSRMASNAAILSTRSTASIRLRTGERRAPDQIPHITCAVPVKIHFPLFGDFVFGESTIRIKTCLSSDVVLVDYLVRELVDRGVDIDNKKEKDMIVTIGEWDTIYGRSLPASFKNAVAMRSAPGMGDGIPIAHFHYLRGLDGNLPRSESNSVNRATSNYDISEGRSQIDYVSRLPRKLLEKATKDGRRIRAIGILGSDYHDKIMLIKAMKDNFPEAILFTTDLDARYLDRDDIKASKNLLIASSFGLESNSEYADSGSGLADHFPFRDSYQTALYKALTTEIQHIINPQAPQERDVISSAGVWEIGRTQAVLVSKAGERGGRLVRHSSAEIGQPFAHFWVPFCKMMAGFAGALCLAVCWGWFYTRHVYLDPGGRSRKYLIAWRWALGISAILLFGIYTTISVGVGTTSAWMPFEGMSILGTEIARAIGATMAIVFLWVSGKLLHGNNMELEKKYMLVNNDVATGDHKTVSVDSDNQAEVDVQKAWSRYMKRSTIGKVFCSAACYAPPFFAVGIGVMMIFGAPNVPYKGNYEFYMDKIALYGTLTFFWMLLFYVLMATDACRKLVDTLSLGSTKWDPACIEKVKAERGVDDEIAREWLDVSLISRRTAIVDSLLYYPLIVLLIMIMSRNGIFANWTWPISLVAVLGLSIAYLFMCAFMLRRSALRAKGIAQEKMKKILFRNMHDEPKANRIRALIQEVEDNERGAFCPLSRHPIIRASLIPLGGSGLFAVIENFM